MTKMSQSQHCFSPLQWHWEDPGWYWRQSSGVSSIHLHLCRWFCHWFFHKLEANVSGGYHASNYFFPCWSDFKGEFWSSKIQIVLQVTFKSANFPLFFFLYVLRSLPHSRWKNRVRMRLQEVLQRRFSPPLEPWLPLGENRTRWRGQRVGEKQTLIHRQANRHTGRPYRRKDRHTNIWTTDRQTDRQTDIWTTDTDRQTYGPQTQTDRHIDHRQTEKRICTNKWLPVRVPAFHFEEHVEEHVILFWQVF